MPKGKAKSDDEAVFLTSSQILDNIAVQRGGGGASSPIADIFVSELHRRYRELVERAGGERQAEMLVVARTGLQPDAYAHKPLIDRVPYLERSLDAPPTEGVKTGGGLSAEEKALAALVAHPEWSDRQIAEHAGCNRTSLYRWPRYTAAREALETGRRERPRADEL